MLNKFSKKQVHSQQKCFLAQDIVFYIASAAEYVIIVALIALTVIAGLVALGGRINTTFTNIVSIIQGALGT